MHRYRPETTAAQTAQHNPLSLLPPTPQTLDNELHLYGPDSHLI